MYLLHEAVVALRHSNSGSNDSFATLSAGSTVSVLGPEDTTGLVTVQCNGAEYRVFLRDLETRGQRAGSAGSE